MTIARCHVSNRVVVMALLAGLIAAGRADAQVGKGLVDPNVASAVELRGLPHMTPAIVSALLDKRPFMSVVDLNAFLLDQKLTAEQTAAVYRRAFVQINLNTGTREEFMLIPGSGVRMSREFAEYRPWKHWAQFDREIGKYVGQQETDRFKAYMFIPLNLNTARDDDLLTIPGAGRQVVRAFTTSRPWKSKAQFDTAIGKEFGPKEATRFWRYVVIE